MSGSAILTFKPFPEMAGGPVFTFRPARPRETRFLQYEAQAEGVAYHEPEAFREEALRALRSLWPADQFSVGAARLRRMWIRIDAGQALPPSQARALDELNERLARAHPVLGEMAADNLRFLREAPRIAASLMLDGWRGLSVPISRVAGRVPAATLDAIEKALGAMAATAAPDQPEGQAFLDLTMAALIHANGATGNPKPNPKARKSEPRFTQERTTK